MVANSLQPVSTSLVELMGAYFLGRRQSLQGFHLPLSIRRWG